MRSVRTKDKFSLKDKIAIITGGAGLLGSKHAEAIAEFGGTTILLDVNKQKGIQVAEAIKKEYKTDCISFKADITNEDEVDQLLNKVISRFNKIDILINNAANNPKVEGENKDDEWTRLENFPINIWDSDLNVGLKGAFICSKIIGAKMADQNSGVILNIASDLGAIAPDQRIYQKPGISNKKQPVKPITYSVVKHGIVGLSKYLATYWADKGVRSNALLPGGVYQGQDEQFVKKLTDLIPFGRMADVEDYKAAIVFLVSDASSYMTGSSLIMDGGRSSW